LKPVVDKYEPLEYDTYDVDEDLPEPDVIFEGTDDCGYDLNLAYNNFKIKARNYVAVEKGGQLRLEIKLNDFVC
jgi:hypothetical protein